MASLEHYARNVTSRNGEDGMVAEVMRALGIATGTCVEFGAWDGQHLSNTWDLWANHGWRAVLIEGDPARARTLRDRVASFPGVVAIEAFVEPTGPRGLDALLSRVDVPADFDLLSIDVDGPDYRIWQGLTGYRPKLVVIEYNPSIPATVLFLEAPGSRSGASAATLDALAVEKGYRLVGLTDTNLFFLKQELVSRLPFVPAPLAEQFVPTHLPIVYSDYDGNHFVRTPGPWGFHGAWLGDRPSVRQSVKAALRVVATRLTGRR